MQISITQEDINNGVKHSCTNCAGALAIARAFNFPADTSFVTVSQFFVVICSHDYLYSVQIPTPRPLVLFINAHDANARVFPMTFDLDLSEYQILRLLHGKAADQQEEGAVPSSS